MSENSPAKPPEKSADPSPEPSPSLHHSNDAGSTEAEPLAEELEQFEKIIDEEHPEFKKLLTGIEAENISAISDIEDVPSTFVKIKNILIRSAKGLWKLISYPGRKFLALPKAVQKTFIAGVLVLGVAIYFVHRTLDRLAGVTLEDKLFLKDLGKVGTFAFSLDEEERFESFYDSARAQPSVLLLPKVVVNIKPTADSSENPMAAFEIYVEAYEPEVLIEMKEREIEFRDALERSAEEVNYDEFSDVERRKNVAEKFRRDLGVLLKGGVSGIKRIRFKTVIFKT